MVERLRTSELAVFVGWVVFVVAGLGFQKMTEDPPFTMSADAQPIVGIAFDIVVVGAVVALLGVLVAGGPIAWAIVRSAIRTRRWRQIALLTVPVWSLVAWLAVTFLLLQVHERDLTDALRVVLFVPWIGTFLLGALASTVAVSVAAISGDVDPALYRRAVGPAVLTAIAMTVVLVAVAIWGVALLATNPTLFWGDGGVLRSSTAASWLGIVATMGVGTLVAARSAASVGRHLRT